MEAIYSNKYSVVISFNMWLISYFLIIAYYIHECHLFYFIAILYLYKYLFNVVSRTKLLCSNEDTIWVRSRNCACLVTWFCYQMIAKPGNNTATVSWPDPYFPNQLFIYVCLFCFMWLSEVAVHIYIFIFVTCYYIFVILFEEYLFTMRYYLISIVG